jgi:aryl-alcohol dehydrogenase-like predicted oxidoreductase
MYSKLALGSVQFGLSYGINNSTGQVSSLELKRILQTATNNKIDTIDTAFAYGNSEENLGNIGIEDFNVISKLPSCNGLDSEIRELFLESLQRLKKESIYGYLFHDYKTFFNRQTSWETLLHLKEEKKIKKIGFSLYNPTDLEYLLDKRMEFDIIQIPFNVFDTRFVSYFEILKKMEVEIHTRSAFLQGLFIRETDTLPSFFDTVKSRLQDMKALALALDISVSTLCLNYVLSYPEIDKVVIGVDNASQLYQNMESLNTFSKVELVKNKLTQLSVNDENILNPAKWKI